MVVNLCFIASFLFGADISVVYPADNSMNCSWLDENMIDWKVETGKEKYADEGWFFPSFHIQEYLLPIINVGFKFIDEYNDTVFDRDDCMRLKGNIEYMLDSGCLNQKSKIRYETLSEGIKELDCESIKK